MSDVQRVYFSNLDLLRFIAALWVVATHFGHIGPAWRMVPYTLPPDSVLPFFKSGYLGVPAFFTLSGFLISFVSEKKHTIDFAFNRVVRLMPAFWVSMTLTAIVIALVGAPHNNGITQWLANLILVLQVFGYKFVDGVYWTLVHEFIFYGWVVILLFFGVYQRYLLTITTLWLAVSAANMFILQNPLLEQIFITELSSAFIAGMLFYHMRKHGLSLPTIGLLAYAIVLMGFGLVRIDQQDFLVVETGDITIWTGWLFAVGVVASVGVAIFGRQVSIGVRPIATLGAISYPLYLLHQEIGYGVIRALNGVLSTVPALVALTIIMIMVAYMVHRWAERPMQRLMARLAKGPAAWLKTLTGRMLNAMEIRTQAKNLPAQ